MRVVGLGGMRVVEAGLDRGGGQSEKVKKGANYSPTREQLWLWQGKTAKNGHCQISELTKFKM